MRTPSPASRELTANVEEALARQGEALREVTDVIRETREVLVAVETASRDLLTVCVVCGGYLYEARQEHTPECRLGRLIRRLRR